jgi:ATP-dependent Zn protease
MNNKKTQKNNMKKIKEFKIKFDIKTVFIVLFASFFIYALVSPLLSDSANPTVKKSLSEVIGDIKKKRVSKIIVEEDKVIAEYKDKSVIETSKEPNDSFREILQGSGISLDQIDVETKDNSGSDALLRFLANILPAALLFFLFMYIIRQARGAQ